MTPFKSLRSLSVGSTFTVPGDGRVLELLRLSPSAALVRPARGHGRKHSILDPETGEALRTFEDRASYTISLQTVVIEVTP